MRRSGVFIVNFEHFTPRSSVSMVNFEQVIAGWTGAIYHTIHSHFVKFKNAKKTRIFNAKYKKKIIFLTV